MDGKKWLFRLLVSLAGVIGIVIIGFLIHEYNISGHTFTCWLRNDSTLRLLPPLILLIASGIAAMSVQKSIQTSLNIQNENIKKANQIVFDQYFFDLSLLYSSLDTRYEKMKDEKHNFFLMVVI